MPKNIEKLPPQSSKGGENFKKKWKRYDVRQKILSGLENFCDILKQKSWRKKKNKKQTKKHREVKL